MTNCPLNRRIEELPARVAGQQEQQPCWPINSFDPGMTFARSLEMHNLSLEDEKEIRNVFPEAESFHPISSDGSRDAIKSRPFPVFRAVTETFDTRAVPAPEDCGPSL